MADIYFDFSAANHGDGTTAAQAASNGAVGAYKTTDGVSPVIGDIWWCRRSGTQVTITTNIVPVNSFAICGWPIIGDENYDDRPASGTANGWDGDNTEDYAEIYKLSSALYYISTTVTLNGFYTSRMYYSGNSSITNVRLDGKVRGARIYRCRFSQLSVTSSYHTAEFAGNNYHITDCIFDGGASTAATTNFNYLINSIVENCTFSFGLTITYSDSSIFSNLNQTLQTNIAPSTAFTASYATNCQVENMNIDSSAYTGIAPGKLIASTGDAKSNFDLTVKGNYTTIVISSLTSNWTMVPPTSGDIIEYTTCAFSTYNSSITMENFQGNTVTGILDNTVVFFKNCIIPDNGFGLTNLLYDGAVYSLNHGGVAGYWKAFNWRGIIESSDVYRTGGSSHSLRCMLETAHNDYGTFPTLGSRNRGEVIYLDLAAGTHTVTVYGAHRLFANALTRGELFTEIDWLDVDGRQQSSSSVRGGALVTDASVWVGDTDLTVFKMEQTITIPTDQQVPVRILGTYIYENSAYLYIDPIPVVT